MSGHMDIIASYVVEHFKVHGENDPKTEVILHELSSRTGLNGGRMIDLTRKPNGSYATDGLSRFLPFPKKVSTCSASSGCTAQTAVCMVLLCTGCDPKILDWTIPCAGSTVMLRKDSP